MSPSKTIQNKMSTQGLAALPANRRQPLLPPPPTCVKGAALLRRRQHAPLGCGVAPEPKHDDRNDARALRDNEPAPDPCQRES